LHSLLNPFSVPALNHRGRDAYETADRPGEVAGDGVWTAVVDPLVKSYEVA
jgi:hypothetical protein